MSDPVIDTALVTALVADQFPQWARLPIRPVDIGGVDNRTFHLGDELSVRLPSAARYRHQVDLEHRWLPVLAPHVPRPIPVPLAKGAPGRGYPFGWSVYPWLPGDSAAVAPIADLSTFAVDVAGFLAALQRVDPTSGPPPGLHNFFRGGSLASYDAETRRAITALSAELDPDFVTEVWDDALASTWDRPPVWVHGDIAAGNLLVVDGVRAAVIDFGCAAVGDPACDLVIAWTQLAGESRSAFRAALSLDADTWARARGWALWKALISIEPFAGSDPAEAGAPRRVLADVLQDR